MRRFTKLFQALDQTTRTKDKVGALVSYFRGVSDEDAAWAVWFLIGNRPKRAITTIQLREFVATAVGVPLWLVEESYDAVGDLGETMSLLLDTAGVNKPAGTDLALSRLVEERLLPLAVVEGNDAGDLLLRTWRELSLTECFLFQKLITGNFRVGVSCTLVTWALAEVSGIDRSVMAHRLMGQYEPTPDSYRNLIAKESIQDAISHPYPFYLAYQLEQNPKDLGEVGEWQIERKWDGIRAQLIKRQGQVLIWSRGEELITDGYPEIESAAKSLPDGTVLDGELLAWKNDTPLPFSVLQRRLGRKNPSAKMQIEAPVALMVYDALEAGGQDIRGRSTSERRTCCQELVRNWLVDLDARGSLERGLIQGDLFESDGEDRSWPVVLSPLLDTKSWSEVAAEVKRSRELGVEGVMLKRKTTPYGVGREKGRWWKWKSDPLTIDAVMMAAQQGHGRRASLFTDYTFAVWDGEELVSIAKAYSGLTDEEIQEVDQFVRNNTTSRHGPVRGVKPELVFELAFEGIQESCRHKSGIAFRFPRINRWRRDKAAAEADTLENVQRLAVGLK